MSETTAPVKRVLITVNVPDDLTPQDVAIFIDCEFGGAYRADADATVYDSEDDYLTDLAEMVCRTGPCWRCGTEVTEQFDRIALDGAQMNTCQASDEFDMPHEIDEPE